MILNDIISEMKKAEKIAILPHISADGDALGSSIALGLALRKLNKNVSVFLEEDIPFTYGFLPGLQMVETFDGSSTSNSMAEFDLVMALDTGDIGRLGKRLDIFNSAASTVNIDHHQTNTMFAGINYVETRAAAVGEIIYQLLKLLGLDFDDEISSCLYVAIATDTGGFSYSNTTGITHQIAADLINNGINVGDISQQIFENTSYERIRLMGMCIDSMELLEQGKVSLIAITSEMMKNSGASDEDSDGIVNIGRSIRGVEVAVLLKEKKIDEIRVNLRSKAHVDVSAIASKFAGGGHKRASGCTIKADMQKAREMVLQEVVKALGE